MSKQPPSKGLLSISNFDKSRLKNTQTTVTSPSGNVFVETKTADGFFTKTKELDKKPGHVIDTKPDLQVAEFRKHIFVSSQDPAADRGLLRRHGITHVLNVAGLEELFPGDFTYKTVFLYDTPEFEIANELPPCFQFIEDALENNGKVLIHCNAGISRSSTIAIAYVMVKEKLRVVEALQQLQKVRPLAKPNPGFMRQLNELENCTFSNGQRNA